MGSAGHLHQIDSWTAGQAWGIWTAHPHLSLVQNHQGQGTRERPKLTNTFCSAMLGKSCFQAPTYTTWQKHLKGSSSNWGTLKIWTLSVASLPCFPHTSTAGSSVENMGVLYSYLPRKLLQEAPGISIHCYSNTIGVYWKVMGDDWNRPDLICSSSEHPGAFLLITAF